MWRAMLSDKTKKPSFRQISPIVYWSSWSFALLNILFLSPTFFIERSNSGLALVGQVPSVVWGIIFIIMGFGMIIALLRNHWILIKIMLMAGLTVKALFAWALMFTLFSSTSNLGVVGVWFGMMVWQSLCIIYFTPEMKHVRIK